MSQDVFQQKINKILEKCSQAIDISDDAVVFGKNEKEHSKNLLTWWKLSKKMVLYSVALNASSRPNSLAPYKMKMEYIQILKK